MQPNLTRTLKIGGVASWRLAVFAVLALSIALNLVGGSYSGVAHAHDHEHAADHHHDSNHGHDHPSDVEDIGYTGIGGCEQDCGGPLHEHPCSIVLALVQPEQLIIGAQSGAWNPSVPSFELTGPRGAFERPPRA